MIEVIDISGRNICTLKDNIIGIGEHDITWDAGAQSSGIYFFKIKSIDDFAIRKALFIK